MGSSQSSIVSKLSSHSLGDVKAGLATFRKEYRSAKTFQNREFFRAVLKPVGVILGPSYPAAHRAIKLLVLEELPFLADFPPGVKPAADFYEPFTQYVTLPLLQSCYEKDGQTRKLILVAMERFIAVGMFGELQEFAHFNLEFFKSRDVDMIKAIVVLKQSLQSARNCSLHSRPLLLDLHLDKFLLESEPQVQEALLAEFGWILQNKWHVLSDQQAESLFAALLTPVARKSSAASQAQEAYVRVMQLLLETHKLNVKMHSAITNVVSLIFDPTDASRDHRALQALHLSLLATLIPRLDSPGAGYDDDIRKIIHSAALFAASDFANFVSSEREMLVLERIVDCIGLLPLAQGSTLCQPPRWNASFWNDIIMIFTWALFLSKSNLSRALNQATERLWSTVGIQIVVYLSMSSLIMMTRYLHPRRLVDATGIAVDCEPATEVSTICDLVRQCTSLHPHSEIGATTLNELLNSKQEKELMAIIKRQLAFLVDYKLDDAHHPASPLAQIQKLPGVMKEFFQGLNLIKASIVSFLRFGVGIQRRNARELEDLLIIMNSRMSAPGQIILVDMWNKVLSNLMLLFEDFSKGGAQAAADHHLKEMANQKIFELSAKLERANQQILELQQVKSDLEASAKNLRKENEHIVETFSCAICFENLLAKEPVCLDCGHLFCAPCVNMAAQSPQQGNRCAICRQPYTRVVYIKGTQQ